MLYPILALAGLAVAQAPGGGIPAGLTAPNTSGFTNPTIHPSRGGRAVCVTGNVSVTASTSKNIKLNYAIPANQSQVTETFLEVVTPGSPLTTEIIAGMNNVTGTYNISATLCTPGTGSNSSSVQFLSHGIGFDGAYWDFAPGYSYVDVAADKGYTTFFYDRLGVGLSARPDPINIVQGPYEVAIAHELILKLRAGNFSNKAFKKVIGTGHSFGSFITNAITAQYPTDLDAAVLTGFSVNTSAVATFVSALNLAIASENQPYRFSSLNNGYLVSSTAISNQIAFFRSPGFDPSLLSLAEATKGTVTVGELLTQTALTAPAKNFTGPIAVVNGAEDLPFCFGNCSSPVDKTALVRPMLYPAASNLSTTYVANVTGHGLNLHYSAEAAFEFIQKFIMGAGL